MQSPARSASQNSVARVVHLYRVAPSCEVSTGVCPSLIVLVRGENGVTRRSKRAEMQERLISAWGVGTLCTCRSSSEQRSDALEHSGFTQTLVNLLRRNAFQMSQFRRTWCLRLAFVTPAVVKNNKATSGGSKHGPLGCRLTVKAWPWPFTANRREAYTTLWYGPRQPLP
jgi:hypothetical protein